jgi:phenylacetate-coenzyme A ligase PaaK-like adenylate-forming protein
MSFRENFIAELYKINESNFNIKALDLFNYQYFNNPVYNRYANLIKKTPESVKNIIDIPFLPVSLYKTEKILTGNATISRCFYSSGTTDKTARSKHYVTDLKLYEDVFTEIFRQQYGDPSDYIILALLPSYEENKDSSLLYMVNALIKMTGSDASGFLSNDHEIFLKNLPTYRTSKKKLLVIGVAHALIELAEKFKPDLSGFIVMETGGMKGRRAEMVKSEMHGYLKSAFNIATVHSEYGMTELLSQAYSKENGIFECPSWMKVLIRQVSDPFDIRKEGRGAINVVDLANIDSCAFIEIEDLANLQPSGKFEILGRMDNSEIRGCNLLYA